MGRLANLKKACKKYSKKFKQTLLTTYTVWNYEHGHIQDDLIVINSKYGMDLAGNMLRIMEAVSSGKYGHYRMVLCARKEADARIRGMLKTYAIKNVHVVSSETALTGWAERAHYIFTDVAMPFRFIKKEGQIIVDTWHGTPLKTMGRHVKAERHSMGNLQRGFAQADYLVYPNLFMQNVMLKDYMVENILCGQIMHEGYPRNTVFFDDKRRAEMRQKLDIEGKKIFVYMPTHRGDMWNLKNAKQHNQVEEMLTRVDLELTNNELMYVKMHLFNGKPIDFSQYTHVLPFPDGYEVYDVLNTADCLITDYSSVFFDFANTGKKIILFAYDEKEYITDRGGLYLSLDELPFPKVRTVDELLFCMRQPKEYDDTDFRKTYCTYDNPNATDRILRHVLLHENSTECLKVGNGKPNVMIFAGSLRLNGITSACTNLLERLEKEDDCNYFASFFRMQMNSEPQRLDRLPKNTSYLSMYSDLYKTLWETLLYKIYIRRGQCKKVPKAIHSMYRREWKRFWGDIPFKAAIDFDGYQMDGSMLIAHAPCIRTIFVHSNMEREAEVRATQQLCKLNYLYNTFDHVAVVGETLVEPTAHISGRRNNIIVVPNQFDFNAIRIKGQEPVKLDKDTSIYTINPAGLEGALRSPGFKFISIGRYSAEKNHSALIDAFDSFCDIHPDAQLIVIGGHGNQWNNTLNLVKSKKHLKNICLVKSMSNPYAVLNRCDLYILSSLYEGQNMTLMEAAALNKPIISTKVGGTEMFADSQITVVDVSKESLLQAMIDFAEKGLPKSQIDFEKKNNDALLAFKKILDD